MNQYHTGKGTGGLGPKPESNWEKEAYKVHEELKRKLKK